MTKHKALDFSWLELLGLDLLLSVACFFRVRLMVFLCSGMSMLLFDIQVSQLFPVLIHWWFRKPSC